MTEKPEPSESSVQKVASLHEKAVQAVAEGKTLAPPKKRRRRAPAAPPPPLDKHIKVLPLVWEAANKIIEDKGNWYLEIEIVDDETVIVR